MDTNELVTKLTADLKPVKRLSSPTHSGVHWIILTTLLVTSTVFILGGIRSNYHEALSRPSFIFESIGLLIAGLCATSAAFQLRVPRTFISAPIKILLAVTTAVWIFELIYCLLGMGDITAQLQLELRHHIHQCLINFLIMLTVPSLVMVHMLKKGAATHPIWGGYAALMAAASFAAIGMRYFCPVDASAHLLVWHFLPVIAVATIGACMGRYLLKW